MLNIQGINQFYNQSHILWDLDLELKEGSCSCLLGRNGVGKTTLLKCITGLLPVRDGQLSLKGQAPKTAPARASVTCHRGVRFFRC